MAGDDADPLFKWLEKARGEPLTADGGKFLLDVDGEFAAFFPKEIDPLDTGMKRVVERLLA